MRAMKRLWQSCAIVVTGAVLTVACGRNSEEVDRFSELDRSAYSNREPFVSFRGSCLCDFVVRFLLIHPQANYEKIRTPQDDELRLYSRIRCSLSAFPITDTELKLIAALAIIGLSSTPSHG